MLQWNLFQIDPTLWVVIIKLSPLDVAFFLFLFFCCFYEEKRRESRGKEYTQVNLILIENNG